MVVLMVGGDSGHVNLRRTPSTASVKFTSRFCSTSSRTSTEDFSNPLAEAVTVYVPTARREESSFHRMK